MPENRYTPYVDMTKREFGALSCGDAAPSFFVATDLPTAPTIPAGYTPQATEEDTKLASLQTRFGRTSTIATEEEKVWAGHYDSLTNTWDTDDPLIVPPAFKVEVADYITEVNAYAELKRIYDLAVFTAQTAQWRLYISDAILALSPEP
jgi:hypothetical protein